MQPCSKIFKGSDPPYNSLQSIAYVGLCMFLTRAKTGLMQYLLALPFCKIEMKGPVAMIMVVEPT